MNDHTKKCAIYDITNMLLNYVTTVNVTYLYNVLRNNDLYLSYWSHIPSRIQCQQGFICLLLFLSDAHACNSLKIDFKQKGTEALSTNAL